MAFDPYSQAGSSRQGQPYNLQSNSTPSQEGPSGVNLTGKVRILNEPGHDYRMSIGDGGFSDVYKGEYSRSQSGRSNAGPVTNFVAVKLFRMSMNGGLKDLRPEKVMQRIARESKLWFSLNHPNIQPYLGYCLRLGKSVALVSPYCGNSTIMTFISNNPGIDKFPLVTDVAEGLSYLHSINVIHCDLNCNNILVNASERAILTDFGRARMIGDVFYSTPLMAGTAQYMAPELFPPTDEVEINELFSKKSDVYAFGILSYQIFTEEEPFACHHARLDYQVVPLVQKGKRPLCTTHVRDCISQRTWAMMEACWAAAPENRPSADQIAQGLH